MKKLCSLTFLVVGLFVMPDLAGRCLGPTAPARQSAGRQAGQTKPAGSLAVVNESGKLTTVSATAFAKLPRKTVKATDHAGVLATYDGVSLVGILRSAKTTLGKDLKGALLANCVLVEAADGYRVVFSLVEIDPELTDNVVLVADRKDGKVLDDQEGPYRLVVPSDKRHMRWVRQVTQIAVRPVGEIGATKKDKQDSPDPSSSR